MRDTIEGERIDWARHIIWGNYRITGGMPLPGSNAWATNQTWGALKTQTGQPVVWGARQDDDNIVWSVDERRQHRLERQRRRQHRLEHRRRRQHRLERRHRRQHRLERRRRRQHRLERRRRRQHRLERGRRRQHRLERRRRRQHRLERRPRCRTSCGAPTAAAPNCKKSRLGLVPRTGVVMGTARARRQHRLECRRRRQHRLERC